MVLNTSRKMALLVFDTFAARDDDGIRQLDRKVPFVITLDFRAFFVGETADEGGLLGLGSFPEVLRDIEEDFEIVLVGKSSRHQPPPKPTLDLDDGKVLI
jgi:hypothetical protein